MGTDKKKSNQFVELANPNKKGVSKPVDVTNLKGKYKSLNVNNGSSYSRKNSQLQERYYLKKVYENGIIDTRKNTHKNAGVGLGKLKTIQLNGRKKNKLSLKQFSTK